MPDPRDDGAYNPTCDLCGESVESRLEDGWFAVDVIGEAGGFVLVRCVVCCSKTTVVDGGES